MIGEQYVVIGRLDDVIGGKARAKNRSPLLSCLTSSRSGIDSVKHTKCYMRLLSSQQKIGTIFWICWLS